MGDDQQGLPDLVEVDQEVHHLLAGAAVQRAGRLVGEQQGRAVHQGAGHRDPLAFAAAERGRVDVLAVRDAEFVQQFQGPAARLLGRGAGQLGGQGDVVEGREVVDQIEELEDHADVAAAEQGQPVLVQLPEVLALYPDGAGGRPVQPGHHVQQGGLAAPRGPHHGDRLTRADPQVDAVERLGVAELLVHPGQLDDELGVVGPGGPVVVVAHGRRR